MRAGKFAVIFCGVLAAGIHFSQARADAGSGPEVVFISPGYDTEVYWTDYAKVMQIAARELRIQLEIIYTRRSAGAMVEAVREVAARPHHPDFVLFPNETVEAPEILPVLEQAKIPSILVSADLNSAQRKLTGEPREKYRYWKGSLIPDNRYAGYLEMEHLVKSSTQDQAQAQAIVIAGDPRSSVSNERIEGLKKFVAENPSQVTVSQVFYGAWDEKSGYDLAKASLARYPGAKILWTANDAMADGALRAVYELKRVPGKDIWVGGMNWSSRGLDLVEQGLLDVSVGGQLLVGGSALVWVSDFLHGDDFGKLGPKQNYRFFAAIDRDNISKMKDKISQKSLLSNIFKKKALFGTPRTPEKKYDFSVLSFF